MHLLITNKTSSRFPGLLPTDEVLDFLKLFTSKNPTTSLASTVALEDKHVLCDSFEKTCPSGFVLDNITYICYKILDQLGECSSSWHNCHGKNTTI